MKTFLKFASLAMIAAIAVTPAAMSAQSTAAVPAASNATMQFKPAKYIILFIGDGMSLPQRMLADKYSTEVRGKALTINELPFMGFTKTSSADSFITDSAASGTAIACGEKTNNHFLGVTPDRKKVYSSAYFAHENGYSVGILSSITINHATPAAFYAHNDNRDNYYEIGLDLVNSNFEYFGGGGVNQNNDRRNRNYKGDIYDLAKQAGYTVAYHADEIRKIDLKKADKILAYGHGGQLPYAADMKKDDMSIADYTKQAIEFLTGKGKPFFMMVEGGMIDSHGHANDAGSSLHETMALDDAVAVAVEFYKKHPAETLIIVTGDHETGGLTLGFNNTGYSSYIDLLALQNGTRDAISGRIDGIIRKMGDEVTLNDEMKDAIRDNFGLIFPDRRQADMDKVRARVRESGLKLKSNLNQLVLNQGEVNSIQQALGRRRAGDLVTAIYKIFDNKCGVGWTSGAHTALPVATSAIGVNAENFSGMFENTDISKRVKSIIAEEVKKEGKTVKGNIQ